MIILFRYFWIALIIVTVVNAYSLKRRSKKYMDEDPELKKGYDQVFKAIILYGNIPWVIMGVGILGGMVNNVFDFFNPRSMNPIILIFYFSIIVLWAVSSWWIYAKKGAEFLEKHPGIIQVKAFGEKTSVTAKQVKLFFPLILAVGIVGIVMMWVRQIHVL